MNTHYNKRKVFDESYKNMYYNTKEQWPTQFFSRENMSYVEVKIKWV